MGEYSREDGWQERTSRYRLIALLYSTLKTRVSYRSRMSGRNTYGSLEKILDVKSWMPWGSLLTCMVVWLRSKDGGEKGCCRSDDETWRPR